MGFTIYVRNLGPLRNVEWSPHGVCCLTGPNGSGKSTLLLALRALRRAFRFGLSNAIATILGGAYHLRTHSAGDDEPIELALATRELEWRLVFTETSGAVSLVRETLQRAGQPVLARDSTGRGHYRGSEIYMPHLETSLAWSMSQNNPDDADLEGIVDVVQNLGIFHDPDFYGLRRNGSRAEDSTTLHTRSKNTFTVLRDWHSRRKEKHRYQFVLDGLRAAFGSLCHDIDFSQAGQTIIINTYRRGEETPLPINYEANGLLALLVQLTAVASAQRGGAIAIDEPENALHPFAIREFLRRAETWAANHDVTIVLTTHSPVVLNYFQGKPEQIFVMEPALPVAPLRLDQHERADWLADFLFGDSYANCHFGAPEAGLG